MKRIVLVLSLVTMIAALGAGLITPIFQIYLYDNLNFSVLTIGLIYSIYTIALAVFPIPFGIFSDKKGRKPTIALGLLGYSISYLFRIFARKPEEFGVLSSLEGLGDSSFKPAAQSDLNLHGGVPTAIQDLPGHNCGNLCFLIVHFHPPSLFTVFGFSSNSYPPHISFTAKIDELQAVVRFRITFRRSFGQNNQVSGQPAGLHPFSGK